MIASELVVALVEIAAQLGVPVRSEAIERSTARRRPRGGLCRVRGVRVILLDSQLTAPEQVVILARALAAMNLDGVELKPALLAALRAHGHAELTDFTLRPLARAKREPRDDD